MSRSSTLQLSVTEFAVPAPRLGSLESEAAYGVLPQVGTDIHLEIQAERQAQGGAYVAEKWVTHTFPFTEYKVTVSGRMDGFQYGTPPRIDEIKSSYSADSLLQRLQGDPSHPYLLQLRTYGYFHFRATGVEPELNLMIVCARTRKRSEWTVDLDVAGYEAWLSNRLQELVTAEKELEKRKTQRRKAAGAMMFPFPQPRPGQRELIADIEAHLGKSGRLLLQAPTGLGKTAGVLFPTLKEALSRGQKAVYVTAKNSQHGVAEDAVERLQAHGCKVKSVTVHAKSKMCLKDEVFCSPSHCEFARDYYTKIKSHKVVETLRKKRRLTETVFKDTGREFEVCPFELQLETVPSAEVVICDYNYVFSPRNISGRLLHNGYSATTPPNLIIDEAHNLAARANDYYSSELSRRALEDDVERATYLPEPLWLKLKALHNSVSSLFDGLAADSQPRRIDVQTLPLESLLGPSQELLRAYLESDVGLKTNDPVLAYCNAIGDFASAAAISGEEFIHTFTPEQGGRIRITCCDASKALAQRYAEFANVVAFSATLKPFEFHLQTLGLDPLTTYTAEFQSPFPADRRKILIIPQVSTKWRDRSRNAGKIKDAIEKIVALKPGNYFVFFPSFEFLNQVAAITQADGFHVLRQERDMRRKDVDQVLDRLREAKEPTLVFAVQGGVFSEGIDYPGRMIIGAMIVGPALPTFDFEREELRKYFDSKGGPGFDYAYTFPAMTRVIQSAGRVIRSAEDFGLIVLMDQRFLHENYLKAMPADWLAGGRESLLSQKILQDIGDFWKNHETV